MSSQDTKDLSKEGRGVVSVGEYSCRREWEGQNFRREKSLRVLKVGYDVGG